MKPFIEYTIYAFFLYGTWRMDRNLARVEKHLARVREIAEGK